MPDTPDLKAIHERIVQTLSEAGIETHTPNVLGQSTHGCGMPGGVRVSPGWSPVDGLHTILVTPQTVETYTLNYPTNHNEWRQRSCRTYGTPEQMVAHVRDIRNEGKGCWS